MKKEFSWKSMLLATSLALATVTFTPVAAQSQKGDSSKSVLPTYNGTPPAQSTVDSSTTPVISNEEEPQGGERQKPVVPTYDGIPPAQNTQRPDPNDVSNTEEPRRGDSQKPVVPTYDKKPDPRGEAQKFDAIRYQEQNEANDGRATELEMNVIEEAERE